MTFCSYSEFAKRLRLKNIKLVGAEPLCPKQGDSFCMQMSGHCEQGNRRNCIQYCTITTDNGGFYRFQVVFVREKNTREGYIVKEALCIQNLLERGIISESDLLAAN